MLSSLSAQIGTPEPQPQMSTGALVAQALVFLVCLALLPFLMRDAWRSLQPARLLVRGRYPEARAASERLLKSWMSIFPSVRIASHYTIASARHLEGDLEAALEGLEALENVKTNANLRYAIQSLLAATLVLLEREPQRALVLLDKAKAVVTTPDDDLLRVLALHQSGGHDAAERLFTKVGKSRAAASAKLGSTILFWNQEQQEGIFHALRGIYLVETGRLEEAREDFSRSAKTSISSVYVERARAMLASHVTNDDDDDDPRSSLAGQVMGEAPPREEET